MSWVDEQIANLTALWRDEKLMDEAAPVLYNRLWDELQTITNDTAKQGFFARDNHPTAKGTIVGMLKYRPSPERRLTLQLADNKRSISVKGDVRLQFTIALSDGREPCLHHEGEALTIQAAAQKISGFFLFPELHKH